MTMPRQLVLTLPALFALACSATPVALTGELLDPQLYRAQIVAVDAVVFEDGPLGEAGRGVVSDTLLEMATAAEADGTNTIAKALGRDLRTLATQASRTTVGTPLEGSPIRQQWIRIRGSLFADAAWFRWSPADPVEPEVAGTSPRSGLRPATAVERKGLNTTIYSISLMIRHATEDLPNANDSDERRRFDTDVLRELAIDKERLGPAPPALGVDIEYRAAHEAAAASMRNLDTLAWLGVGPPGLSREYVIGKAEEQLVKARAAAAKMMPAI